MTRTARLTDQGELISTLPYILGYHPRDALVLVFLRDREVQFSARLDLPPPPGPLPDEVTVPLRAGIRRERPEVVMAIIFDDSRMAYRGLLSQVTRLCRREKVRVGDRLLVAEGRWRDLDCSDPRCCPPEGRAVRSGDAVPAVAEFVAMGRNPLPDRESIERFFEPPPEGCLAVTAPPKGPPPAESLQWRRDGLTAWGHILGTRPSPGGVDEPVDPSVAQQAVDLLSDLPLRDALIAWLCPDLSVVTGTKPSTRRLVAECLGARRVPRDPLASSDLTWRLREFARALPPEAQARVLTVTGAHSWSLGEGIFARVALARAAELEPSQELASLLLHLVYAGVRLRPGA